MGIFRKKKDKVLNEVDVNKENIQNEQKMPIDDGAKTQKNIFTSSFTAFLMITIITVLTVLSYPISIDLIEGNDENKISRVLKSDLFSYEQFYYLIDSKLKNRDIVRAFEEHPEQKELMIKRKSYRTSSEFTDNMYSDFVSDIYTGRDDFGILGKFYISDSENKLVQTNMSKSEIEKFDNAKSLLKIIFAVNEDGFYDLKDVHADDYKVEVFYKQGLFNIFQGSDAYEIEQHIAQLYGVNIVTNEINGVSKKVYRISNNHYNHNEFFDDGTVWRSANPSKLESDRKVFETVKNVIKEVKELPEEEITVKYYVPIGTGEKFYEKSRYYLEMIMEQRAIVACITALASIFIMMLFAIILPYRLQAESAAVRRFNDMPLEIKWLITAITGTVPFLALFIGFANSDVNNKTNFESQIVFAQKILSGNTQEYFICAGISAFICLALVYFHICYIKKIFADGFMNGFVKNSVILSVICKFGNFVWQRTVLRLREIISFDIDKNFRNKLIIISVLNCAAVFLLIVFMANYYIPVGAVLLVIVLLGFVSFGLVYDFLKKLVYVQDFSRKLSQGDFEVKADENFGVFSKTMSNLNSVREGFKKALDEEIKSRTMKTELISNVSHDLKTPLTSIINYSDLLGQESLSEETKKEYIQTIHKKSERLKVLIEDLFEASKASSGNIVLNKEKLDIISVFRQTMGELEEKIAESELDFRIDTPPAPVYALIDGQKMYRVFSNIISNIVKYSMKGTRVYIKGSKEDGYIVFEFKNISNYEMNFDARQIAERFKRGDESRNTEGSGLGLAIAKSLVELHGGKLEIEIDGDLFKLNIRIDTV